MGFFSRLFGTNKKETSLAFKWEMAKKLDGKHLKYVSQRIEKEDGTTEDIVIGKDGALIVKEDQLLVYASADVLMRLSVPEMTASELLSGDGVILSGSDIEHGGKERTVIAYYTYYL